METIGRTGDAAITHNKISPWLYPPGVLKGRKCRSLIASLFSQKDLDLNSSSTISWLGPGQVTEHQGTFVCK